LDADLQQQIDSLAARVTEQAAVIAKLEILIKHYEEQLLMARRHRFGSLSEKYPIGDEEYRQLGLFGDGNIIGQTMMPGLEASAEADKNIPEPQIEEITYTRKKHKGKREEDLSGLPVERIDHELPEEERACPECGEAMKDIGVDMRRSLKLIPAKVVVVEDAVHAYACHNPDCPGTACTDAACNGTACNDAGHTDAGGEENGDRKYIAGGGVIIVKAAAPAPLISGSLASPSLVAHIAVQKYSNGLPLYRIENGFRYDGVNVSRQTMANWVIKCSQTFLFAIYVLMIKFLLKESVLHADETTYQVLREPGRAAQSKSYEWIYRTSGCSEHKIVIYEYKETRGKEHPKEFLKNFKGFLHTDYYDKIKMPIKFIKHSETA